MSKTNKYINWERIKHEKDEKSSLWYTNMIKKTWGNLHYKRRAMQKEQKNLYKYNISWLIGLTLGCTYRKLIKPNYTQRIEFKNICIVSPKRNIEIKHISYHPRCLLSVLENHSVPFSPHNSQQRETHDPLKNLASNKVPKALERNHHHIANTTWLNQRHSSLWKYPMPQSLSNQIM